MGVGSPETALQRAGCEGGVDQGAFLLKGCPSLLCVATLPSLSFSGEVLARKGFPASIRRDWRMDQVDLVLMVASVDPCQGVAWFLLLPLCDHPRSSPQFWTDRCLEYQTKSKRTQSGPPDHPTRPCLVPWGWPGGGGEVVGEAQGHPLQSQLWPSCTPGDSREGCHDEACTPSAGELLLSRISFVITTFFRWGMWWRIGQSWRSWWTQERCWEHIQVGNNNMNAIAWLRDLVITWFWGGDGLGNMDLPHGCLSEYFLNISVGNYPLSLIEWGHWTKLDFSLANTNIVFITVITLAKRWEQYPCKRFAAAP